MRVRRAFSVVALFLLVSSAGCLTFFSDDSPSETGLESGSVGERRITIEPVNETELALTTTTGLNDTVGDTKEVITNGSVVSMREVGSSESAYLYNGSVYRIRNETVNTRVEYTVWVRFVTSVEKSEIQFGVPFEDLPEVDKRKWNESFEAIESQRYSAESFRNPPDEVSIVRRAQYYQDGANKSRLVNSSVVPVLYNGWGYTLYPNTTRDKVPVKRFYRVKWFDSKSAYAEAYVENNTISVSLNETQRMAFKRVASFEGNVSVSSLDNRSLVREFERNNELDDFYYSGLNERTWLVKRNGKTYAVRVADPDYGIF